MRALWLRRVGFSLALALGLGYLPYRIYQKSGLHRYVELRDELVQLTGRNDELRKRARRMRAELETLSPPEASNRGERPVLPLAVVERAARDELGLVRPGELVFQIAPEVKP